VGRWSDARLGEAFGPLEFLLTREFHRRFVEGTRNELEAHDELVDPTVAGNLAIYLLGSRYPGPIIHSHQELELFGPVRIGETVVATGTLSMKETRRGKSYVAIDCDFERDGGRVWWARMTCIWPEVHLRGEV
jgi:hypothetical protein